MSPFLQGILVGLTFAVLLGPAFFSLIQTSIQRGFRSGLFLALGISFTSNSLPDSPRTNFCICYRAKRIYEDILAFTCCCCDNRPFYVSYPI